MSRASATPTEEGRGGRSSSGESDSQVRYLITDACTGCGACLLTCPTHAVVVGLPLTVRADRCTACGECVEVCPADAVLEVSA